MKQFLDRFDQSSIWVRIFILALLMLVLMMGLVVARSMQRSQQAKTTITAPSKSSTSTSSKSPEEEAMEKAEEAVKKAEDEQNEGNLRTAKEKVDDLPDGDRKNELMNRLQAVASALGLDLQGLSAPSSSSSQEEVVPAASSAAPVTPAASQVAPQVEQPVYSQSQDVEQPTQPIVVEPVPEAPVTSTPAAE